MLDENQQQQVLGWMREWFVKNDACPMCGNRHWEAGNVVVAPTADVDTRTVLPIEAGPSIPMVQMCCATCGYIMLLDGRRIGLLPGVPQGI
jgi:hypothetical protein